MIHLYNSIYNHGQDYNMATMESKSAATAAEMSIPAAVSESPTSKKRAAESPASPEMSLEAAKKTLAGLKVPQAKGATQSEYVRFKSLLLKDSKARGDKDTTDNITKIAKEAWKKVQHLTPPSADELDEKMNDASSSSGDDLQRYLRLKGVMLKEKLDTQAKFDAEAKAYCALYVKSASSFLQWCLIEATEENHQPLLDACKLVKSKSVSLNYASYQVDDSPVSKALRDTIDLLAEFKKLKDERALVAKLQNATEEELKLHAKEHIRLLAQDVELNKLKKTKEIEDERQRLADERELQRADGIQDEITRALKKQMKYGSLTSKYSSTKISYTKGGVSHKVFAKAFGVPVGAKKATIDGSEVGENYLRYGASLKCNQVNVKLVGDELVAQTSFYMSK